jgi:hypothetical protein
MKRIVATIILTVAAPAPALAHAGHGVAAAHDHGLAAALVVAGVAAAALLAALRGGGK